MSWLENNDLGRLARPSPKPAASGWVRLAFLSHYFTTKPSQGDLISITLLLKKKQQKPI